MKEYKKGNLTILQMIYDNSFDETVAEELISNEDLNETICGGGDYPTTYLFEAVTSNNVRAVKYLLEHGADPNFYNPEIFNDCPLWELQYIDEGQSVEDRYEIEKLFFKHGGNPNIVCDNEDLYSYVLFKINEGDSVSEEDYRNLHQFYKLLELYGGDET